MRSQRSLIHQDLLNITLIVQTKGVLLLLHGDGLGPFANTSRLLQRLWRELRLECSQFQALSRGSLVFLEREASLAAAWMLGVAGIAPATRC